MGWILSQWDCPQHFVLDLHRVENAPPEVWTSWWRVIRYYGCRVNGFLAPPHECVLSRYVPRWMNCSPISSRQDSGRPISTLELFMSYASRVTSGGGPRRTEARHTAHSLRASAAQAFNRLSAPAILVGSFLALIAIGTVGLMVLPGIYAGAPLGLVDALFTITSAVCVTGLIVVDTATYFTFWGQLWILVFIQLGGLGLITLTSIILGATGHRVPLRTQMVTVAVPDGSKSTRQVWQVALEVTRFTLVAELCGALVLMACWWRHLSPGETVWHAVFHSISAFCNAGFSTFSDSLVGWQGDPAVLLVVSSLIIFGGLGFFTVNELAFWWRSNRRRMGQRRLSSHTMSVLVTTTGLLAIGTVSFAIFEWNDALGGLRAGDRIVNAWFMSVTARTAGFNAVDYGALGNDAAFATIMLMFVGGAPGSTAGGIKATTLAVLVALAWSRFRGRRFVQFHKRGVPEDTIERAVSLTLLAVVVLTVSILVLNALHQTGIGHTAARADFLPIAFEAVSALATVGLSMGMTAQLDDAGKIVLVLLMFIGRVGLFSFFAAMTSRQSQTPTRVRPAADDILIG